MYIVTMTRADGHVFNHEVSEANLRDFLAQYASVLFPGETLSFRAA